MKDQKYVMLKINPSYIFVALSSLFFALQAKSQLSITSASTNYTINFDQTVSGVNNGAYQGNGFTPTPGAGQLDSDGWRAYGANNQGTFGGSHTSGAFARGVSTGGVINGNPNSGVYGFDRDNSSTVNRAFGIQHFAGSGGNVFTPGHFTLKIQNNTGSTIQDLSISYDIFVYNDKDGLSTFNFSHSSHGNPSMTWTNESSLNYTTPGPKSTNPTWSSANSRSKVLSNVNIPDNGFYYLRWTINDASGNSSPRDEIALDNIDVNAVQILPVDWLSFNVSKDNGQSVLQWETTNEVNNDSFFVQNSNNAKDWNIIGKIAGSPYSNSMNSYSYIHTSPDTGANYYRIMQVDKDGSSSMSVIRYLDFKDAKSQTAGVYPNPVRRGEQINIRSNFEIEECYLYSASGTLMQKWEGGQQILFLSHLTAGTYFLKINGQFVVVMKRIIVLE